MGTLPSRAAHARTVRLHLASDSMTSPSLDQTSLEDEIADLERRLQDAKAKLPQSDVVPVVPPLAKDAGTYMNTKISPWQH